MTEFGLPRHPRREGSSPDAKFAVCHSLSGRHRDREVPSAFCALWSQIEHPALHRRHFGRVPAALGQEVLPRSFLVPATGICALLRFQVITQSWIQRKI